MNTRSIGFKSESENVIDNDNLLQYIAPQDLKSFGLIPELIGRMPVVTHLDPLDKSALEAILREPKNSLIKQYQKLFDIDGVRLSFEKKAISLIVEKALEFNLGARGLRSICEAIMLDAMYELPSDKDKKDLRLTAQYVKKQLNKFMFTKLKVA